MAKAYKGLPVEGVIATWYARNTAGDPERFTQTARLLSERLRFDEMHRVLRPGGQAFIYDLRRDARPAAL